MGRTKGAENKHNLMREFRRMTNIVDVEEKEERRRRRKAQDTVARNHVKKNTKMLERQIRKQEKKTQTPKVTPKGEFVG